MNPTKVKQECFVMAPIGSPDSSTRKKSDQVFKHIIKKALEPLGYEVTRADQINEPGIITSQVVRRIVDSPLALADLSERNPNVFYELAVRHVTRKPLIMITTKGEPIPFDISANRVIQYDLSDLDTVEQAIRAIASEAESLKNSQTPLDNPIGNAIDTKSLSESSDPGKRSLASILEAIAGMNAKLGSIQNQAQPSRPSVTFRMTTNSDFEREIPSGGVAKKKEFISANMLEAEAKSTGYGGGDWGHGGRSYFSITDLGATGWMIRVTNEDGTTQVYEGPKSVELLFGGDTELDTSLSALEFAVETLKSADIKGYRELEDFDEEPDTTPDNS